VAILGAVAPAAASAVPNLTVVPSGNAAASIVMKVNGLEQARCIWDGTAITGSTPDPDCTYTGAINPGDEVRVESFPAPEASLEYLSCPTTPFGPRGNFCQFTVGPPGPFSAPLPATVAVRFQTASSLTVQKTGNGQGTVTGGSSPISCGSVCSASLPPGTTVVLTATPAAGSVFTGFTGCTPSAANPAQCTVVVSGTTVVTAGFALLVPLTVALAGDGAGTVVSSPAGISCGVACSTNVAAGTVVQLTASPAAGSLLTGFTGCTSVSGSVCTVTVSAATAVTATFGASVVEAAVTGWRTTKTRARRTTRVTIDAEETVDVKVTISRRGRAVASKVVRGFRPGTRAVVVAIPRRAAGGRAALEVVLTNEAGTAKAQSGRIRIPPRPR